MPSNADAAKSIEVIGKWSRSEVDRASKLHQREFSGAVSRLDSDSGVSVESLMRLFLDSSANTTFRLNCADILGQIPVSIPATHTAPLKNILGDKSESPSIRIRAGAFILRTPGVRKSDERAVVEAAANFLKAGVEQAAIRVLIMPRVAGNAEAISVMLDCLESETELGPTLWTLGKLKGRQSVRPIVELVNRRFGEKDFPKTRAYLALGEIGGEDAFDALVQFLGRESDETRQHVIVHAIGLSRSLRAKEFLLQLTENGSGALFVPAIRGLQYLGDKSSVPMLEKIQGMPLTRFKSNLVLGAIKSIKVGPLAPAW